VAVHCMYSVMLCALAGAVIAWVWRVTLA